MHEGVLVLHHERELTQECWRLFELVGFFLQVALTKQKGLLAAGLSLFLLITTGPNGKPTQEIYACSSPADAGR